MPPYFSHWFIISLLNAKNKNNDNKIKKQDKNIQTQKISSHKPIKTRQNNIDDFIFYI
jgi:hypothetical protein